METNTCRGHFQVQHAAEYLFLTLYGETTAANNIVGIYGLQVNS